MNLCVRGHGELKGCTGLHEDTLGGSRPTTANPDVDRTQVADDAVLPLHRNLLERIVRGGVVVDCYCVASPNKVISDDSRVNVHGYSVSGGGGSHSGVCVNVSASA